MYCGVGVNLVLDHDPLSDRKNVLVSVATEIVLVMNGMIFLPFNKTVKFRILYIPIIIKLLFILISFNFRIASTSKFCC